MSVSFLIVATVLLFSVGIIWSKKDIPNLLIKMTFYGVAFWGAFLIFRIFA